MEKVGLSDWFLLIAGAFLGLGISLLWEQIQKRKKDSRISKICSPYEGIYLSFDKYDNNQIPKYYFELKRDQNKFFIRNGISITGHEDFDAEIIMHEPGYKRGVGYYQHKKSPDGLTRFGFLDIQLAKDEILVHVTIHKDGKENSDAYRWTKLDSSIKESEERKYREIQQKNKLTKFSEYLDDSTS